MKSNSSRTEDVIALALNGWRPSDIALWFGISRQRVEQIIRPEQHAARVIVLDALKRGDLQRPAACETCGEVTPLEAHHPDYSQPLAVRWLCRLCHKGLHRILRGEQLKPSQAVGIPCPNCEGVLREVTDTRARLGYVQRRRVCEGCGERFSTREKLLS